MIFGTIDDQLNVTITFNANTDSLRAPEGFSAETIYVNRKWHPCSMCGIVEAVTPGIVHFRCDACVEALKNPDIKAELLYVGRCIERGYEVPHDLHDQQMLRGLLRENAPATANIWLKLALRRDREIGKQR